jgi:hypothetical protein
MAQKVTVELEDDLDGGPAEETVRFGVDGLDYEIDLSKKNAAALPQARTVHRACPQGGTGSAPPARAYRIKPGAQRRYPGVGERPGHRGQRARAHPRERR